MNKHSHSLRAAPAKQNEKSWRRDKNGKAYPARAKKYKEWQAFPTSKGSNNLVLMKRPVPGNVGSLEPKPSYPRPTVTGPVLQPFEGKSAYRDKGCKTPDQFRNGKTLGTRQKPKTEIIGIIR